MAVGQDAKTKLVRRILLFSLLITLSMLLMITNLSCKPAPPPTSPSPPPDTTLPPSPPAPLKWAGDGIFSVAEYAGVKTFGDFEIRWANDEEYVYIGMKAKTTGWVAVGIQPGSMMKDADMVFGFVKDGKATVYDHFSTGAYGPHSPDTELGGKNDILEYAGKEDGGYTIIEFKRALSTGDSYDQPVSKGANRIIWAYGSDDELKLKHIIRGYGEIDL